MQKLRLLDLFSGIGGFSIGAEMTNRFETVAFCEIEPFPRAVLAKWWPDVPCFPDVTKLTKDDIHGPIDAICAGFPCQDLSYAGKGAGIEGARSGLWSEVVRLIGEFRPAVVMLENVPAILTRGLGTVLSDLAQIGYNAFWDCIRASDLGAPHRRDRWFLVAYPSIYGWTDTEADAQRSNANGFRPYRTDLHVNGSSESRHQQIGDAGSMGQAMADSIRVGQSRQGPFGYASDQEAGRDGQATDAVYGRFGDFWSTEPDVGRVANGVPNRTHRLKALGNAIVPLWAFLVSKVAIAIYEHQPKEPQSE
jgi:DNA (cytosine-5)-methyltransferase 1